MRRERKNKILRQIKFHVDTNKLRIIRDISWITVLDKKSLKVFFSGNRKLIRAKSLILFLYTFHKI